MTPEPLTEEVVLEEGTTVIAISDGDLSMFAMDEVEEGEIEELACRRQPDEAELIFVSTTTTV